MNLLPNDEIRVGFTCSTFDLAHAGHVMMLKEAKEQCDYLIVGLQVDPSIDRPQKNKPVQTLVERYIQLSAIKFVDEIIPYQTEKDLIDIIQTYPIDVRILGVEYAEQDFTGRKEGQERGMEFYFNRRDHRFSSSDLRKRVFDRQSKQ